MILQRPSASRAVPLSGCIIAVVDDDRSVLESLDLLLQSAGYVVRLFASGKALLESGNFQDIDCLISDIDLPEIDGFELLRLVHLQMPKLPVILITGHHDIQKQSRSIGARYTQLFEKPFNPDELLITVGMAVHNP